jgi:hypothetical protein
MSMVDKIKEFWHDQIPGWLPIFLAIVSAAFWIGSKQQSIDDRLNSVEVQIRAIQEYLRTNHEKAGYLGPTSGLQLPQEPESAGMPVTVPR